MEGVQLSRVWKQVIVSGRTMRVREREQGRLQGGFRGKTTARTHREDIFLKKAGGDDNVVREGWRAPGC